VATTPARWVTSSPNSSNQYGANIAANIANEEVTVEISARNQFKGTIKDIKLGNVMAEVVVDIGSHELVSAITRGSVERMQLKPGDSVTAIVKSTEVMIGK
jgi:molybdopterin-binding protein